MGKFSKEETLDSLKKIKSGEIKDLTDDLYATLVEAVNNMRSFSIENRQHLSKLNETLGLSVEQTESLKKEYDKYLDLSKEQHKKIIEDEKKVTENLNAIQDLYQIEKMYIDDDINEAKKLSGEERKQAFERIKHIKIQNEYQLALAKYAKAEVDAQKILSEIKAEEARNATRDALSYARRKARKERLRDLTENDSGQTKSNKEYRQLKDRWTEFKEENTRWRKGGIIASKITGAGANAANFLASDKQMSISDIGNKAADIAGNFGPWGKAAGAVIQIATQAVEMYDKVNKASADYARSVGGGVAKMEQMKRVSTGVADAISKIGGKAYKFDKILEHTAALSQQTGRVMDHMSQMDFKSLEDLNQWGIGPEVLNQYDSFGLSMETIDKKIHDIYSVSGKHGLNAKAVTEQVNKNLKLAQNYQFAGGLKALTRMAEKAAALKIDMGAASAFADKVSTLEGAATTGAELSVLGGSFARMANPLSLLYGGLQDEEKLFDMMLNTTKGKVQWDQEKGGFMMNAFDMQQLKAAAQSMGVDYNTLWNAAQQQGKRDRVDAQLRSNGSVQDKDVKEYIRNITQFDENGNGYVTFHQGGEQRKVSLSGLTDADKAILSKESELMSDKDNAKVGDVLVQTRTMTEQLNDIIDTLRAKIYAFMIDKWGTKKKTGEIAGLDKNNSKFFAKFARDYRRGGLSDDALDRMVELGLDRNSKEYKQLNNKQLTQGEAENLIIGYLLKKQNDGFTFDGGTGAKTRSINDSWSKTEGFSKGDYTGNIPTTDIAGVVHGQEFVMNADSTNFWGLKTLRAMNDPNTAKYFKQMSVAPIQSPSVGGMQGMQITMSPIVGEITLKDGYNGKTLSTINTDEITRIVAANIMKNLNKMDNYGVQTTESYQKTRFMLG